MVQNLPTFETVARVDEILGMPQEKRDRARNMLEHGRSLKEAVEVTRLSMYIVRRLRQQVMAAQIIKRNRKSAREISFTRSGQFS